MTGAFLTAWLLRFSGVAPVWFVGFVMVAALGKERFAFTTKRSNDSLAQMLRFRHKVIELPQDFVDRRPLERIHGDRRQVMQSLLRKSAKIGRGMFLRCDVSERPRLFRGHGSIYRECHQSRQRNTRGR